MLSAGGEEGAGDELSCATGRARPQPPSINRAPSLSVTPPEPETYDSPASFFCSKGWTHDPSCGCYLAGPGANMSSPATALVLSPSTTFAVHLKT